MDPYKVLGVDRNADEETIKKAYRELVKKYHPDKYVNNPLADLAAEKIKEINKAYDVIMNNNGSSGGYSGNTSSGGYTGGASGGNYGGSASFAAVRSFITQGRVNEAAAMLNSLPRTAEWYYLSGRVRMQMGWYDQALSFFQTAVNMEPNNAEYVEALQNLRSRRQDYTNSTQGGGGMCMPCDPCTMCLCLQCCTPWCDPC